ncbi:MAG: hypothetical protein WCR96_03105 [Candidatus Methanomethylophilaceae archaeon]
MRYITTMEAMTTTIPTTIKTYEMVTLRLYTPMYPHEPSKSITNPSSASIKPTLWLGDIGNESS